MMKAKISNHLQLKFFQLLSTELKETPENKDSNISIDFDFMPIEGSVNGEKLKGFKVSLKINSRKKNTKLAGNIEAIGFFDIDLEKEKPNILFNNGLSIICGLLRGIIFEKATILNLHEKLLPTVDLTEIIKKKINTQLEN